MTATSPERARAEAEAEARSFRAVVDGEPVPGDGEGAAWTAVWARGRRGSARILGAHTDGTNAARILAGSDGRTVVVSAGGDGVAVWSDNDPVGRRLPDAARLHAAQVLPDGRAVAAVTTTTGALELFDLATAASLGRSTASVAVTAATTGVLSDGTAALVLGADDGSVRLWDLATGERVLDALVGLRGAVTSLDVTVLRGTTTVVVGTREHTVALWSAEAGTLWSADVPGTTAPDRPRAPSGTTALATSLPDGLPVLVVASSRSTEIQVWNVSEEPVAMWVRLPVPSDGTVPDLTVATSSDGARRILVVSSSSRNTGTISTWDLMSGEPTGRFAQEHDVVPEPESYRSDAPMVVTQLRDGRPVVLVAWWDKTVSVIDVDTARTVGTSSAVAVWEMPSALAAATLPGDGLVVVTAGGEEHAVRLWAEDAFLTAGDVGPTRSTAVTALAVTDGPPGRGARVGHGAGLVAVHDLDTGATVAQRALHDDVVSGLATVAGPDGPRAVSVASDGLLRVWHPTTLCPEPGEPADAGAEAAAVACLDAAVEATAPRGSRAVTADSRGARMWDLDGPTPRRGPDLLGHAGWITSVALTTLAPRRRRFARRAGPRQPRPVAVTGGRDGTVRVWEAMTGEPIGDPLTGHDGPVLDLAVAELSAGLPTVVSVGEDGTVRSWDLGEHAAHGPVLTGHRGPVPAVASAALAGGRVVAVSGGADGTLRLWDLRTMRTVGHPLRVTSPVRALEAWPEDSGLGVLVGGDELLARVRVDLAAFPAASRAGAGAPRTDGFYLRHLDDTVHVLRFHPSGESFAVSIGDLDSGALDLETVAGWVGPRGRSRTSSGPYLLNAGLLEFTLTSTSGAVAYRGEVSGDALAVHLDIHSLINGYRTMGAWYFAPVTFPRHNA